MWSPNQTPATSLIREHSDPIIVQYIITGGITLKKQKCVGLVYPPQLPSPNYQENLNSWSYCVLDDERSTEYICLYLRHWWEAWEAWEENSPWPVLTVQNFCVPLAKAPKKFDYYLMLFFQFLNSALPRLQIDFSWGLIMNNIPFNFTFFKL